MFLYLYSEKKPPLSSLLPFTLHARNNPVNTFRLFLLFYIVLSLKEKAKVSPFYMDFFTFPFSQIASYVPSLVIPIYLITPHTKFSEKTLHF
ncbi:hypothetical protein CON65_21735 [Bacillus pseudomycoides]|uniref:Uncharacterized protein n=1 Tax=Bacillus pseudomycoides TaxID=64104 RepID=A0AA91ZRM6_9BACI|nr:hypothetical protein COO03_17915 [Bacillus sp. AFS098217]PED80577.1 hypothetical protein CON65_21735 [Bacillus pseudomycoides]PEU17205.1 hypothetical protein CN525_15125 [Bacillus sp. AFS014408]PEU17352.1 hypothetical protein CN524_02155 [Bacillus sp. AFS019443]PFW63866.1 hypothetical protein COL20_07065 [Bacillus sp. AFS075034]